MRYEVRRVSLWSTFRFGLMAGVALMALPGLCMAVLAVQIVRQTVQILNGLTNINVDIPDVDIGLATIPLPALTINLINTLGLENTTELFNRLSSAQALLFLLIVLGSIVFGALLLALPLVVFSLIYNMIAPTVGGFEVYVRPRE